MIVYVYNDSKPLHAIRMLVPFQQVADLVDISYTYLDDDYLFNDPSFSDGGYRITGIDNAEGYGAVSYDFFQTDVYTKNNIKSFEAPKSSTSRVIAVEFKDQPILPGTFRLIRIIFKITSPLDELWPRTYNLKLHYFDKDIFSEAYNLLNIDQLEIPVNKLFNKTSLQGGLNVFVYLPESLSGRNFNANTQTTGDQLPDGTRSKKVIQKFIWRARLIFPENVNYLYAGKSCFIVEGLLNDPYELDELRRDIGVLRDDTNQLRNDTGQLKRGYRTARRIAIFAVIIALITLCSTYHRWIINFFKACFRYQ